MAILTRACAGGLAFALCALGAAAQEAPIAHAHYPITTTVAAAQTAFDRGLVMMYAFNVGEATLAFRAAEAADPHATLPYVGEAIAQTIDINRPTSPDGERRGADAIARGRIAAAAAPLAERALFAAAAARFDERRSQKERFAAFFHALQAYADAHPTDGLGSTLAAYAGWNATDALSDGPNDPLTADAQTIASDLDRALAIDPADVGAHHLRIHFWEEVYRPERARSDADDLAALLYDPGESHLQHMAGHIYDRLGNYAAMVAVNRAACANDERYFAQGDGDGQRYMQTYHEHDVDFVLYGLTTMGDNADAVAFAAHESLYSREIVAMRIHDDAAVLGLLGAAVTPMRVIAEARLGNVDAAKRDLAALASGGNEVGRALATAAIARATHDDSAAIAAYRKARAAVGTDLGDPKLHWWEPVGEGLGTTLLAAHQPVEAETVFRAELVRYPNDPHLWFGLAEALAAQGKDDSAPRAAYRAAWEGARPLTLADLG